MQNKEFKPIEPYDPYAGTGAEETASGGGNFIQIKLPAAGQLPEPDGKPFRPHFLVDGQKKESLSFVLEGATIVHKPAKDIEKPRKMTIPAQWEFQLIIGMRLPSGEKKTYYLPFRQSWASGLTGSLANALLFATENQCADWPYRQAKLSLYDKDGFGRMSIRIPYDDVKPAVEAFPFGTSSQPYPDVPRRVLAFTDAKGVKHYDTTEVEEFWLKHLKTICQNLNPKWQYTPPPTPDAASPTPAAATTESQRTKFLAHLDTQASLANTFDQLADVASRAWSVKEQFHCFPQDMQRIVNARLRKIDPALTYTLAGTFAPVEDRLQPVAMDDLPF